jgi:hypothetical protein
MDCFLNNFRKECCIAGFDCNYVLLVFGWYLAHPSIFLYSRAHSRVQGVEGVSVTLTAWGFLLLAGRSSLWALVRINIISEKSIDYDGLLAMETPPGRVHGSTPPRRPVAATNLQAPACAAPTSGYTTSLPLSHRCVSLTALRYIYLLLPISVSGSTPH